MAFNIKRNDTLPVLKAQLLQSDGGTPIDLTAATSVSLVMKPVGAAPTDPPTFKNACVVTDDALGQVEYRWAAADTADSGSYNGEFEVAWSGGAIQTLPLSDYFQIVVVSDLG